MIIDLKEVHELDTNKDHDDCIKTCQKAHWLDIYNNTLIIFFVRIRVVAEVVQFYFWIITSIPTICYLQEEMDKTHFVVETLKMSSKVIFNRDELKSKEY